MNTKTCRLLLCLCLLASLPLASARAQEKPPATIQGITWEKNFLTVRGNFPGEEIKIHYLEAYCRAGSTDRDWGQTVIPHATERLESTATNEIRLRDTLSDGLLVDHVITSSDDDVTFELTAHNPTKDRSQAHWAQPCMRVDGFTGADPQDARSLVPKYVKKCFLFVDGQAVRLPTKPWAEKARYVPGQVYRPEHVDRNDVNPRPVSELVPSSSLCGCYSADEKLILAVAWEPYQEIFQGVITCLHNDFRLGGLKPGESKRIRGKLYVVPANLDQLVKRFESEFKQ